MSPVWSRLLLVLCCLSPAVFAETPLRVAVAANFLPTAEVLRAQFGVERMTLHPGATGQLYAQISQGAPFDVFLSADQATAQRLYDEGKALTAPQTYAIGRLALWTPGQPAPEFSQLAGFARLVMADPKLAPYGAAALSCVQRLVPTWQGQWLKGTSVAQAHQMLISGAAPAGFVAWSQVLTAPAAEVRLLPEACHAPLIQQAVLLKRSAPHPAAQAFWDFLYSPSARQQIAAGGYAAP
ncbi:molybdate ABC transporter substrate-binding protein [Atopomonas hussainii]|uniref:molybdate ABC transporter substrate-binding protein n=1 Tax=Atopomonas hussainii TaxID=1429083 RepID=UPI000B0D23B3|nr:molybdate ABC transporter substrate-binding protein [Atopomonas hussainii]